MPKQNSLQICIFLLFFALFQPSCTKSKKTDPYDNFTDWAIYRGDKKGNQYSEIDQINRENVKQLQVAWEYHHGDPGGPSMYSNPIIVDGLMYFTTPALDAIAIDAKTGAEVWRFLSSNYNEDNKVLKGRNRGVAYWKGEEDERIFHFVINRVYALKAKTGELITSFGDNGFIDLHYNLSIDPGKASVEMTSPGIIYRNHLIVGGRVPEGYDTTPGDIRSYNTVTGEFEWIFHTVPHEGEEGYDTWEFVDGETYGGANPWGGFTLDEERGWVFCATGSPAPDFIYGGIRKGVNLFGNCVLALDAETGEKIWHYQTLRHDIFDYDNPPAPILCTITKNGSKRDVVVQLTKPGLTFVLDRETGEPVFPIEERPVPVSMVKEEEAWPTQPFPLKPPPLVRQVMTENDLTDISPEAQTFALREFRKYDTGPMYTPPNEKGVITVPGYQGGAEWGGGAFNPATNVLFVNVNEAPTINKLALFYKEEIDSLATPVMKGAVLYKKNCTACHGASREGIPPLYPSLENTQLSAAEISELLKSGKGLMAPFLHFSEEEIDQVTAYLKSDEKSPAAFSDLESGIRYTSASTFFEDQEGFPAISPPWGAFAAIDLSTGELVWKVRLGEYPELVKRGVRNTGAKNFGGPVATAGGIVFIAATPDEKIRAFDQQTGEVLWEHQLPAAGYATPSVYKIDGKQYLAIACGGGGKIQTRYGDAIIAFALPD